jgi:predicted nucleic acid-binding protein
LILLDTNVLSALMQREPDQTVVAWLDEQPSESVWTTAITVFEVRMGLELLAKGRRRNQLEQEFDRLLVEDLDGRVQLFDRAAADAAGTIAASRQRAGPTVEIRDVQIAGIASSRKATLATRNVRHFQGLATRAPRSRHRRPCRHRRSGAVGIRHRPPHRRHRAVAPQKPCYARASIGSSGRAWAPSFQYIQIVIP